MMERLIQEEINHIRRQRYQFLLFNLQKIDEKALSIIMEQMNIPSININFVLASRLRDIPKSRRLRVVKDILHSIVNEYTEKVIHFNRFHYLFDEELKQDPIGLIEYISGNKIILLNWPGDINDGVLKYGTPDHPEYYESDNYETHIVKL